VQGVTTTTFPTGPTAIREGSTTTAPPDHPFDEGVEKAKFERKIVCIATKRSWRNSPNS
jgi:hypothetical protein